VVREPLSGVRLKMGRAIGLLLVSPFLFFMGWGFLKMAVEAMQDPVLMQIYLIFGGTLLGLCLLGGIGE